MKTFLNVPEFVAGIFCLLVSTGVLADGISIERASGRLKDDSYLVDARIKYELGESVVEAMEHGITLDFEVTVEIREERNFLWDRLIKTEVLYLQMEYQPLSSEYLIVNRNTGDREQLPGLDEALKYLGTINNYNFITAEYLKSDKTYTCFIRAELKINTLPLPLQPIAYVSPAWYLQSQRYEWTVR